MSKIDDLGEITKNFHTIIIWGFKNSTHSHRFIHQGRYEALHHAGIPVIRCDDTLANQKHITTGSLVIGHFLMRKHLPDCDGAYYYIHRAPQSIIEKINKKYLLNHECFYGLCQGKSEELGYLRKYEHKTNTLFQPRGTPMSASRFFDMSPFIRSEKVFFVGSLRDINYKKYQFIKKEIQDHGLKLVVLGNAFGKRLSCWQKIRRKIFVLFPLSTEKEIMLLRRSPFAIDIRGDSQIKLGYYPCRVFKAISYGCLPVSDVSHFNDIFTARDFSLSIEKQIERVMSLNENQKKTIIGQLQKECVNYTYLANIHYIIRCFHEIKKN